MNIQCKYVCKSYKQPVLNDFNAVFYEHKINVITGISGCGKTTLLRLLLGLEVVDSGKIIGLEDQKIACIFQADHLCKNLTVQSNIKLVNDHLTNTCIKEALSDVGMGDYASYYIHECSGGMKRRVAILRALLSEFDVLIMDEPFKGLDQSTKEKVILFLKEKIQNKTVIFVTHDQSELAYFKDLHRIEM